MGLDSWCRIEYGRFSTIIINMTTKKNRNEKAKQNKIGEDIDIE